MQISVSNDTKNLLVTALCCTVLSTLAATDFGLLWFFWVGLFLAIWTLVRVIQCITGKVSWRYICFTLLIWIFGFSITYSIHHLRSKERQDQANIVANKIVQFHQSNQRYPQTLEELGLDTRQVRQAIGLRYSAKNPPQLFYPDTKIIHSVYKYDFATQQWRLSYS